MNSFLRILASTCWILMLPLWALSQEEGFYQRRVFLELDGQGQLPIIQNLFGESKGYVFKSGGLQKSYNLLDAGFRISLNTVVDEYNSIGLEAQQRFYWLNLGKGIDFGRKYPQNGALVDEHIEARLAYISMQEFVLMPRFLISFGDSRVPLGFSSEFGIGYAMIRLADRHPQVEVISGAYSAEMVREDLIDSRIKDLKGLNVLYGFRMNYPINKRLLYHIGFRYQYSMMFGKKKYRGMEESEAWFSPQEVWQKLNMRRQLGIISFGTGLTIML
jgi:hypothetical protein